MLKQSLIMLVAYMCMSAALILPVLAQRSAQWQNRNATQGVLSSREIDDLLFMREEEKLARDVYLMMYNMWDELEIFANIAASEQKHMDAVLRLLIKYEIPDPALGPGEFTNKELQTLYDELVERGLGGELDALLVGVTIEEKDMTDIVDAMKRTNEPDILRVYDNLLAGSVMHLDAFLSQIEARFVE